MFNQKKDKKERRLDKCLDFRPYFETPADNAPLRDCHYVTIEGNVVPAKALFHRTALVVSLTEKEIFDRLYFTLFWIHMTAVDIKRGPKVWRARICMKDGRLVELQFSESVVLLFESILEQNMNSPTLLLIVSQLWEEREEKKGEVEGEKKSI